MSTNAAKLFSPSPLTDKFLKNFNPRPKKFSPSYYNVHFFFKTQVSSQKIFSFHTKRTFFGQMDTSKNVKFLLTASCAPFHSTTYIFLPKSRYPLKKFFDKRWHPHNCKNSIIIVICSSLTFNGHFLSKFQGTF